MIRLTHLTQDPIFDYRLWDPDGNKPFRGRILFFTGEELPRLALMFTGIHNGEIDLQKRNLNSMHTYWNGGQLSPPARRCVVRVGESEMPSWWCASLKGMERKAVEVRYNDKTFFLDDDTWNGGPEGQGWYKVTEGFGGPNIGHRSLPADSIVVTYSDD